MIEFSIIVCSRRASLLKALESNIKDTIGCPYELIVLDNSKNKYSIFSAYNVGIEKSKGGILCFVHEDVLFHTRDWGGKLKNIFSQNLQVGIVGIAGSKIISDIASGWWEQPSKTLVKNVLQHRPDGRVEHLKGGFEDGNEEEVAVIDGVFMCLRRDGQIKFNENLEGFHNYDQSICLDYLRQGYRIVVTNKILLEHFSNGTIDSRWLNATYNFYKLYKQHLPKIIGDAELGDSERGQQISHFIFHCKNTGNAKLAFKFWLKLFKIKPLNPEHQNHFRYFLNFLRTKLG
ncbi:glycosyltransferase [Autumnicola psychrophila]|uniref:Glycosyltransferase n=1 Tax=Autumnicola psychrophila TaxID=3075592 RepID=A0ABU3DUT9_9FLAO|nr:glycosyltransferase [Zunongwangia sp. F225]MDT0686862.1 glycosyltransferase [Zunongwangia sp. F225]